MHIYVPYFLSILQVVQAPGLLPKVIVGEHDTCLNTVLQHLTLPWWLVALKDRENALKCCRSGRDEADQLWRTRPLSSRSTSSAAITIAHSVFSSST
jgi:hypothetical protein